MAVRGKFICWDVSKHPAVTSTGAGVYVQVTLIPEMGALTDNAMWATTPPRGRVELTITDPSQFGQFVVGGEYYVDFSAVVTVTVSATVKAG